MSNEAHPDDEVVAEATEFTCAACGGTFIGTTPEDQLEREAAAFADVPDAPMEVVCDDCWKGMRAAFPSLDARLKLEGL